MSKLTWHLFIILLSILNDCTMFSRFSTCRMSKSGALDLAASVGGKMEKEEVLSAVDEYVALSALFQSAKYVLLFLVQF